MKNIPLLLLLLLSLILSSCGKQLENEDRIVIQDKFGNFLSADRNNAPYVLSNRQAAGGWEIFKVQTQDEGVITLTDFENNAIHLESDTLVWEKGSLPTKFRLEESDGRIYLQTIEGNYLESSSFFVGESPKKDLVVHQLRSRNVFGGYFPNYGIVLVLISLAIYVYLITASLKESKKLNDPLTYLLLIVANGSIGLIAINLFDFLFLWDEQFHALVAKNLSANPSIPLLYTEHCLPHSLNWTEGTIWLHKQPLFLYQMAASIKLFGASVFSVRLPSMIMMSFVGIFIYRIGLHVFNRTIGLIGSALFCFSAFKFYLMAGIYHTDHNDVAFIFYITLSFWALIEYLQTKSKWFFGIIIIGAAFAVLNKWLTGFIVYYTWTLILLFKSNDLKQFWSEWKATLANFFGSLLVVLPWQLYTFFRFTEEATHEYELNGKHLTEAVENHGGEWYYYLEHSIDHYGLHIAWIIVAILLSYFSARKREYFFPLLFSILTVYVFFSWAATKMMAFTYLLSPIVFLMLAAGIYSCATYLSSVIKNKKALVNFFITVSSIALIFNTFNLNLTENYINPKTSNYLMLNIEVGQKKFKNLKQDITDGSVLLNVKYDERIAAMFYTNNTIAYSSSNVQEVRSIESCSNKVCYYLNNGISTIEMDSPSIISLPNY